MGGEFLRRVPWGRLVLRSALTALSLVAAYNLTKSYLIATEPIRPPRELRDAMSDTLPRGLVVFAIVALVAEVVAARGGRPRSRWNDVAQLAAYTVFSNLLCLGQPVPVLATVNVSAVLLAALMFGVPLLRLPFRLLRGSDRRLRATSAVPVALLGVVLLGMTVTVQQFLLQLGNTLYTNSRWTSAKVPLELPAMGAESFLLTRTALHRNRLNLGVWHGYQEVWCNEVSGLREVELRFQLPEESYLVFFFEQDRHRRRGLRVSRNPRFPSALLTATEGGAFLSREPLEVPVLDGGWHRLRCTRQGQGFTLAVDGEVWDEVAGSRTMTPAVGFRGSFRHCYVDDVVIDRGEAGVLHEDFRNRRSSVTRLLIAAAIVLALNAALALVLHLMRRRARAPRLFVFLGVNLFVWFWLGLLFAADHWYLSARHPRSIQFLGLVTGQEDQEQVCQRLREEVTPEKPAETVRVMLVGTSQTWGSGALHREDAWARSLEHQLNERSVGTSRIECINTGICGVDSTRLLPRYRDEWIQWQPDLVVINLSLNDGGDPAFEPNLREFIRLNQERGIQTVLMQEAVSTEIGARVPTMNHEMMAALAQESGIQCVTMHAHIDANADRGFLWWDKIHLTSFGQQLLAEELAVQLAPLVEELPR